MASLLLGKASMSVCAQLTSGNLFRHHHQQGQKDTIRQHIGWSVEVEHKLCISRALMLWCMSTGQGLQQQLAVLICPGKAHDEDFRRQQLKLL